MDETHDDEIIHRELDTTRDSPGAAIAEIVAGLEDTDSDELASVWRRIDDMLRPLFSDPPSPDTNSWSHSVTRAIGLPSNRTALRASLR